MPTIPARRARCVDIPVRPTGQQRLVVRLSELSLHPPCGFSRARNLAMRTLVVRQDWMTTGQLSVAPGSLDGPDVSVKEAKAARLARYAELRWMPEASPVLRRGYLTVNQKPTEDRASDQTRPEMPP